MKPKCFWCGSRERELTPVTLWSGKKVKLCEDGTACIRQRMANNGVKLLLHPKNPK